MGACVHACTLFGMFSLGLGLGLALGKERGCMRACVYVCVCVHACTSVCARMCGCTSPTHVVVMCISSNVYQ